MPLYPLKFMPRFVEKIWAGHRLETELGKTLPPGKTIGESWEIYDFPPGVVDSSAGWVSSILANGPLAGSTLHSIIATHAQELFGSRDIRQANGQFPLLIKFLDAREDLSIQVHPDEAYCQANPGSYLKSEAWYVVSAEPGARLFKGLRPGVTREQYARSIQSRSSESLLNTVKVKAGDCFYLPSGTVHAIGAGILVAEVQTPSDTTFRVHDFNRVDPSTGKERTLHIDQALQCIHFDQDNSEKPHASGTLVDCEFFKIARHAHSAGYSIDLDSGAASVWIMLEGKVRLSVDDLPEPVTAQRGETILLPAHMRHPRLIVDADAQWLKVTFEVP